ncbi:MAG: CHAD domain-containing protein [Gammaproteobacteria bacterium]
MDFYLKKGESAGNAVRRINLELRARVIGIFNDESLDADSAVAEIRGCIEKLRAVLRFTRPAMGNSVFRRCDRVLDEFSSEISDMRESAVMVETFDCLADHYRPFLNAEEFLSVRQSLQSRHAQAMAEYRERLDMKELESSFVRLELNLDRTDRVKLTRSMLKSAIGDVYSRGRELHQLLEQDPDTENSNGLRLEARYLWHQLRMLEKQAPDEVRAMTGTLDELGQLLGDDNNMAVLAENLRTRPGLCCNRIQAELLDSLAETRRIAYLTSVLRLSARIYERTPENFISDLFPQTE